MEPVRLAILASHVVPYRAPLYRGLAADNRVVLKVFYGDRYGVDARHSPWGVKDFRLGGNYLEGYDHEWLPNRAPRPHPSTFWGKVNPALPVRLRAFRPDVVLVMGYAALYPLLGLASAKAMGAKVLFTSDTNHAADPGGARGAVRGAILRGLYQGIDGFLVTGTQNRRHFEAHGVPAAKLHAFPWAVNVEAFTAQHTAKSPERERLRARWGIRPGQTAVVTVSGLIPKKNVGEVLRAAAQATDLFVLVVGTGPEDAALRALAAEAVPGRHAFAGFLDQDALGDAYVAADVFAMPSTYEPWGLTCNEAMCFGLPIVVSDRVGAGPDLVVPAETGTVYPLGDEGALAAALQTWGQRMATDRGAVATQVRAHAARFTPAAQTEACIEAALRVLGRPVATPADRT